MSTITDALNEAEPFRTAGALPSTRTFGMVENALESDDIDVVKAELVHTRAHSQSLEYILNAEETILTSLRTSIAEGSTPRRPRRTRPSSSPSASTPRSSWRSATTTPTTSASSSVPWGCPSRAP